MGLLKAGPGKQWRAEFFIDQGTIGIEDIGFVGPARLPLRIPDLAPGRYRLGQEFIRRGRGPLEERREWHFAEFEVLGS